MRQLCYVFRLTLTRQTCLGNRYCQPQCTSLISVPGLVQLGMIIHLDWVITLCYYIVIYPARC